jgi:hypothetical protein
LVADTEPFNGAGRGRPAGDREQAFHLFASLPRERRSYATVAAEFGVSPRTVERWGREGQWRKRLQAIEAEAAQELDAELAQARIEDKRQMRKLIEATLIGYAEKLRGREMRMSPADLERMYKLAQQLDNELDHPSPQTDSTPTSTERTAEHVADVVAALRDCGGLEALGLASQEPS